MPHIHVYYNEYSCIISILDGKILDGNIPIKQKIIMYQWLIKYKEIILLKWIELIEGKSITKIER